MLVQERVEERCARAEHTCYEDRIRRYLVCSHKLTRPNCWAAAMLGQSAFYSSTISLLQTKALILMLHLRLSELLEPGHEEFALENEFLRQMRI